MNYNAKLDLQYSTCVFVDNRMYLYSANEKVLLCSPKESTECSIIAELKVNGKYIDNIDSMKENNKKIYMLDVSGKYLVVFNLRTNEIQYIDINCNEKAYQNFVGMEFLPEELVVFSSTNNKAVSIDLDKDIIKNTFTYEGEAISAIFSYKGKIFGLREKGKTVCYSTDEGISETDELQANFIMLSNVSEDDRFFCLDNQKKLFVLHRESFFIEDLNVIIKTESMPSGIIATNGLTWILPSIGKDIIYWDGSKLCVYNDYPLDFGYIGEDAYKYWKYAEDEEYFYIAQQAANYLLKINKISGKLQFEKKLIAAKDFIWIKQKRKEIINESETITIGDLINYIHCKE